MHLNQRLLLSLCAIQEETECRSSTMIEKIKAQELTYFTAAGDL